MRAIAQIIPGPSWLPGKTVYEQGPLIRDHLAFMQAAFDGGSLLLGGPMATGMSGLAVLDVPDMEAARAFAHADPAVVGEVLVYEIAEMVPSFDAFSGLRQSRAGGTSPVDKGPRS